MSNHREAFAILVVLTMFSLHDAGLAQVDGYRCGMDEDAKNRLNKAAFTMDTIGGIHKPSITPGNQFLRVLFVFVKFSDDNETTTSWPDTATLPWWAAHIVDSTVQDIGATEQNNLSNYYLRNSYGRFHLIGDVKYVKLPHDEQYYHTRVNVDACRDAIVEDALTSLDSCVDYRRYDRWVSSGEYSSGFRDDSLQGDGVADMIYIATRNLHDQSEPTPPFINIGTNNAQLGSVWLNLTLDGVKIDGSVFGSGISLFSSFIDGRVYIRDNNNSAIGIMVHELTHYHLDLGHFGDATQLIGDSSRWVSYFTEFAAQAGNCFGHHLGYEKYKLGWLTYANDEIFLCIDGMNDRDIRLYEIGDQNPNHIKMIEIRDLKGSSTQSIILESRGRDIFEPRYVPYNSPSMILTPGVLVYNIISEDGWFRQTTASVLTADGNYDWNWLYNGGGPLDLDIIGRGAPNPANGYSKRDWISIRDMNTGDYYRKRWLAWYQPGTNNGVMGRGAYPKCQNIVNLHESASDNCGYTGELFDVGSTITRYTNPAPRIWNSQTNEFTVLNNIGIHIISYDPNDKSYLIHISRNADTIIQYPPNIPRGFGAKYSSASSCMELRWDQNNEPNVTGQSGLTGNYVIERSVGDQSSWSTVATLAWNVLSWSDSYVNMPDGVTRIYYRLHVVDGLSQSSGNTEVVEINIAHGIADDLNTPYEFTKKNLFVVGDFYLYHGMDMPGLTKLYFCPNTGIYLYDTLVLNQIETNEYSKIDCMPGSILRFDDHSNVDMLHTVTVHENATVSILDGSQLRMAQGGTIHLLTQSAIDANPTNAACISSYTPSTSGTISYWDGIIIDAGATGIIRNMHFRHGYSAIESYNHDVPIQNCLFKRNLIGISTYGDNPVIEDCIIDSNLIVGLFGFGMRSDIIGCRINRNYEVGVQLSDAWNYWRDNRIDTNGLGVYCYDASVPLFNGYDQQGNPDTTNGNSIRNNFGHGALAESNSCMVFTADNSVHNNVDADIMLVNANMLGLENYPDPANLPPNVTFTVGQSGQSWYSWTGPFPQAEPVLLKTSGSGLYQTHMYAAIRAHSRRQYKNAIGGYKLALLQASDYYETRGALLGWLISMNRGKLSNILSAVDYDSLETEYCALLDSTSRIVAPAWKYVAVDEVKAIRHTSLGNYSQALNQLQAMINTRALPDSIDRRIWLRVLEIKHYAMKDQSGANLAYLYLNGKYPTSMETIIAKIILRIPLTQNELNAYSCQKKSVEPGSALTNAHDGMKAWCEGYPNPTLGNLTVRYQLNSEQHVRIAVYAMDGRILQTTENEIKGKGVHEAVFDLHAVPAGAYCYKIDAVDLESDEYTSYVGRINVVK